MGRKSFRGRKGKSKVNFLSFFLTTLRKTGKYIYIYIYIQDQKKKKMNREGDWTKWIYKNIKSLEILFYIYQ